MYKRINYITSDGWWDTDKTILPSLCEKSDIHVFVMDDLESLKFPRKEMTSARSLVVFKQRFRMRDIRLFFQTIPFFIKVFKNCIIKDCLNIFVASGSVYFLILFLIFIPRNNTIIVSHNYLEHTDSRNSMFARVKILFYHHFKYFMFFSKGQSLLFNNDFPCKKSFYVDMPPKDFGNLPSRGIEADRVNILFFGIIRDYKRPDLVIKAANMLNNTSLHFTFAGGCKDWIQYESLIEDKTRFSLNIGFVEDGDVASYFSNADFLILPYMDATQSGPSMIAINYGIPIIASDQPAFKDIITDGVNGFLFKTGDADDLKRVLENVSRLTRSEIENLKRNQMKYRNNYIANNNPINNINDFYRANML